MTDHVDAGWYDWVTEHLGRDETRATAAARAASAAVAQGLGFNAGADAARASWEADRLAHITSTATAEATGPELARVPGSLIAATAIACGGATASIALLLWMIASAASSCTDICPVFSNVAYWFLLGNVAIWVFHASMFLLMWRRRAAAAWWTSVAVVVAVLWFDVVGELDWVVANANPNSVTWLATVGLIPALVPLVMSGLATSFHLGSSVVALAVHWLLIHLIVIELPILILLTTRWARRWCRIRF